MTRSRSIGGLVAALACAGLAVAGCGGGGYTAAESAPSPQSGSPSGSPAGAAQAPASDPTSKVIGAFATNDPSAGEATYRGYARFPKDRAGKIFVDPTPKPAPAPVPTAPALTTVPLAPGTPGTTTALPAGPTTSATPAPAPVSTQLVASLELSGSLQTVKVGAPVPASGPQFTVQAITDSKVTLKLMSGSFPGGGQTVDIALGQSVTLSNPTTGASLAVKVVEIKPEA